MEIKINGKFTKRKDFIYRTDTYIQFGESEDIKGSFILCNPGSSRFEDSEKDKKLKNFEGFGDYSDIGKLKADPVMKQLIAILKASGLDKEGGKFLIYNIFTLRNGNMKDAIKELNDINMDKEFLYKDFHNFMATKDSIPWSIVGWGCEDNSSLSRIKRKWLNYLDTNKVNFIGCKHKKNPNYYHVRPQLKKCQEEYIEFITKELGDLLENKKY